MLAKRFFMGMIIKIRFLLVEMIFTMMMYHYVLHNGCDKMKLKLWMEVEVCSL